MPAREKSVPLGIPTLLDMLGTRVGENVRFSLGIELIWGVQEQKSEGWSFSHGQLVPSAGNYSTRDGIRSDPCLLPSSIAQSRWI